MHIQTDNTKTIEISQMKPLIERPHIKVFDFTLSICFKGGSQRNTKPVIMTGIKGSGMKIKHSIEFMQ